MSLWQRLTTLASVARQGWYIVAATVLMTTQPFITTLSKNSEGSYDYLAVSTTLVVECTKFCISLTLYGLLPRSQRSHDVLRTRDMFLFAIPAGIYFINNNLIFVILYYVNSTTYQILSSLKTVFTGMLFRVILKRILSEVQAVSILLLACGAAVSQFPICPSVCNEEGEEVSMFSAAGAWLGAIVALLACLLSAFGGVYSELLLKKDGQLHSIHLQNLLLYAWGVGFNALALFLKDRDAILNHGGLFQGYTVVVWVLIVNNALVGLAISAILKFANNLVRVFAHTAAMLLTMFLECLLMGAPFSPQLVTSIIIVSSSTFLYNLHPAPPPRAAQGEPALLKAQEEPCESSDSKSLHHSEHRSAKQHAGIERGLLPDEAATAGATPPWEQSGDSSVELVTSTGQPRDAGGTLGGRRSA